MQRRENKKTNPYKLANEAFLEVKAKEEGTVGQVGSLYPGEVGLCAIRMEDIPPHSTLVFTQELVKTER